ncbi:MAG TPA: DUF4112 domain-containing protein [Alphaproteobacteria bacterium]|nr:DUF4112 domain-containing protein [Alphaproteobacteria bacterium]
MDRPQDPAARRPMTREERARTRRRLEQIAQVMDSAFTVPGTEYRFGLDFLIGLVPGIGDAITTGIGAYLVWEARRLGAPKTLLIRMAGNVAIDGVVGSVPLIGDLFDAGFKANRRNLRLLTDWLDRTFGPDTVDLVMADGGRDGKVRRYVDPASRHGHR